VTRDPELRNLVQADLIVRLAQPGAKAGAQTPRLASDM
jgi:hypothetical protein